MGGSGGGGGAGAVSWPTYLQNTHGKWLDGTTDGTGAALTFDMRDVMDEALGAGTPYPLSPYSASDESAKMDYVVNTMEDVRSTLDTNWAGYVNTSLSLLDQIISSYGDFLIPDPKAADNILAEWETQDSNGYNIISDDWKGIVWQGWSLLEAGWTLPVTSMTSDIQNLWENPDPDAANLITLNWEGIPEWIELVLTADENVLDNWQELPAWVEPDPDADEDIIDNLANETYVADSVNQFGNVLDDQISADVLPRFEAGMRDINAVMSSAFVIGRSIIEGMRDRDVAKYQADLRYKAFLQRDSLLGQAYMQDDQLFAQSTLENNRTKAADTMEKSKVLSQVYLQNDQLNAQSTIERNRASIAFVLDKNKLVSQAYLQYDQIMAANIDSKNRTLAGATIEEEKIHTNHTAQTNDGLIKIAVNVDQLIGSSTIEWNKARASLLGQDITIENQMINDRNKSLAEAFLNYDKIDADNAKTRNVIAGDHMKHHATLAWQGASTMYDGQGMYLEFNKTLANVLVEANRMKYVMNKEYTDKDNEYDVAAARWDLEVFQYGSNLLAAVSGGTGFTPGPTPGASALGGAFSGAAIGARVSGNSAIGAGAGAVLGGIGGYLLGK